MQIKAPFMSKLMIFLWFVYGFRVFFQSGPNFYYDYFLPH